MVPVTAARRGNSVCAGRRNSGLVGKNTKAWIEELVRSYRTSVDGMDPIEVRNHFSNLVDFSEWRQIILISFTEPNVHLLSATVPDGLEEDEIFVFSTANYVTARTEMEAVLSSEPFNRMLSSAELERYYVPDNAEHVLREFIELLVVQIVDRPPAWAPAKDDKSCSVVSQQILTTTELGTMGI